MAGGGPALPQASQATVLAENARVLRGLIEVPQAGRAQETTVLLHGMYIAII